MSRENTYQLITQKIEQLQSALFFTESSDRIIPSCVLQQVYTNEDGEIWFTIPKPVYVIDPNNTNFPCRMDFFKKGENFHVKISGLASIIDEEVTNDFPLPLTERINSGGNQQQLIIKVKIEQADYFEIPPMPGSNKNNNWTNIISNTCNKIVAQVFGKTLNTGMTAFN